MTWIKKLRLGHKTRRSAFPFWGAVVATGVVLFGIYVAYLLIHPHTSIKSGPRIRNASTLRQLGLGIMKWQAENAGQLPKTLEELEPSFLAELGERTNTFVYLGSPGQACGVLAVERYAARASMRSHWTFDRLAILKTDFSVDFIQTNSLPGTVLSAAVR